MPTKFAYILAVLLQFLIFGRVYSQDLEKDYLVRAKLLTTENGLVSRDVYCAIQDDFGFIWFGTKYGLNRYDGVNCVLISTSEGLFSNTITNLIKGGSNQIFIEYGDQWQPFDIQNRIDVLDCNTLKIVGSVSKETRNQFSSLPSEVQADLEQGRNWRIQSIPLSQIQFNHQISEESARLFQSSNCTGKLLVTRGHGVYYFEDENEYEVLSSEEFYREGNTTVNNFFKDNQGNVWICVEKGVYLINIRKKLFHSMFTSSQLSEHKIPQVRGISVSESSSAKEVKAVLLNALISNSGDLNFVRKSGLNWGILEYGNEMYYVSDGKFIVADPYTFQERRSCKLMHGLQEKVNCIFPLNDSIFLLGRDRDVLVMNRYTLENSAVLKMANADIPDPKNVYRIFSSSHGLIAVAENGIFVLSDNLITDYYGIDSKRLERHLPISYILDACEDDFKNLWLGTNGQGLIKWEWNKGSSALTHYSTREGLPSMIVYRIEQDNFGNIWSSSDDGIFSLNLNSNIVRAFKIEDGLPSNEFNRTSSFKSAMGDLYFGSVNGLVALSPGDFSARENTNSAPLKLVRIVKRTRGNDNEIEILNEFTDLGKINWESSDFLLEMEFALLDFRGYKISYSYRIPGVVNEWVNMERNSLTLGSLPTGVFNIEVRAQLDNGEIVSQSLIIPIEVFPPFYLKTTFVVSTAAAVVLVVLLFIWLRGRKLRIQNLKLERLVAEKTEDLVKSLEDKDVLLKELHHRVKNNLQIIISLFDLQKEQLKDSNAIDAINESQTRLSSIALIHQNFYNTSNLEEINFYTFLNELTTATRVSFGVREQDVCFKLSSNELNVAIESAIPLGLIINEMLTNSFKHVPLEHYPLKIAIDLVEISVYEYEVSFVDNGPGLPLGIVLDKPNSLGLKLVKGLTSQLKGNLSYSNIGGSKFVIRFPQKRKPKQ